MINLIPREEEKKIIKDFYLRVFTIFFLMAGFIFLIGSLVLLPSYFLTSSKKNFILMNLNKIQAEQVPELNTESSLIIEELHDRLLILNQGIENEYSITEKIIELILAKKSSNIKINRINFEKNKDIKKVIIIGTATSRESLLAFRNSFEREQFFEKVDLPISNFIKGKDIVFYLNLNLKDEKKSN